MKKRDFGSKNGQSGLLCFTSPSYDLKHPFEVKINKKGCSYYIYIFMFHVWTWSWGFQNGWLAGMVWCLKRCALSEFPGTYITLESKFLMFWLHMIRERALISCYVITLITRVFDSSMNPEFMSLYQPHSFSFITTFITSRLHLAMFPLQMVIQRVLPSSNKITLWTGKKHLISMDLLNMTTQRFF